MGKHEHLAHSIAAAARPRSTSPPIPSFRPLAAQQPQDLRATPARVAYMLANEGLQIDRNFYQNMRMVRAIEAARMRRFYMDNIARAAAANTTGGVGAPIVAGTAASPAPAGESSRAGEAEGKGLRAAEARGEGRERKRGECARLVSVCCLPGSAMRLEEGLFDGAQCSGEEMESARSNSPFIVSRLHCG